MVDPSQAYGMTSKTKKKVNFHQRGAAGAVNFDDPYSNIQSVKSKQDQQDGPLMAPGLRVNDSLRSLMDEFMKG